MRSITRLVTEGESSESPAAIVWIAAMSSSGARALEQEARGAGAQRAEDVVVLLERREDHDAHVRVLRRRTSRVAAIPSRSGIRTSISTTSGRAIRAR